ncbi:hypothetical protein TcWFU_001642 [Taenia crassiceps]|uniref:Uncharacterized protein n=1 Tax=Taenia crassiceps TaxID=6207 RepID=A0ABR4Q5I9_9CEST
MLRTHSFASRSRLLQERLQVHVIGGGGDGDGVGDVMLMLMLMVMVMIGCDRFRGAIETTTSFLKNDQLLSPHLPSFLPSFLHSFIPSILLLLLLPLLLPPFRLPLGLVRLRTPSSLSPPPSTFPLSPPPSSLLSLTGKHCQVTFTSVADLGGSNKLEK